MKLKEALTWDDVLMIPQYSEIESRKEVDLTTVFGKMLLTTPVISSPMDTVTEADMVVAMSKAGGFGIIHRYNTIQQQCDIVREAKMNGALYIGAAVGATGDFLERTAALIDVGVDLICVDVAHGDHILVKRCLEKLKPITTEKSIHLMAGNIATGSALLNLADWGAESVRIGIGGGCFVPGTKVRTETGDKSIEEVELYELVYTHTGELKPVTDKMVFDRDEEIVSINGIECTKNHEFYVVDKENIHFINEDNIHNFARWVHAGELNKDKHLLIELE